jgi:zinc D-Ala-D-Ala carboxypeptidase
MQKISDHISYREGTFSPTAHRKGIDNTPNAVQLTKMQTLARYIFEPLRLFIGKPIKIESFFRSKLLNKAIGGSGYTRLGIYYATSQHCKGEAMDIDDDFSRGRYNNADMFYFIAKNLNFDQLIWEFGNRIKPDWVHVSYKSHELNRNKISIAYKDSVRTKYKHFTTIENFKKFKDILYK